MHRWRWIDDRIGDCAKRLCRGRQPAHQRRHLGDRQGRMPYRARQQRQRRRYLHQLADQRPWDMTAVDQGSKSILFVSNVLNGTVAAGGKVVSKGTVLRLTLDFSKGAPRLTKHTIIGDGFPERTDPAALVIGPTGVGLGSDGTLYVADTLSGRIAAIPHAMTRGNSAHLGNTIAQGGPLFAPLGL